MKLQQAGEWKEETREVHSLTVAGLNQPKTDNIPEGRLKL